VGCALGRGSYLPFIIIIIIISIVSRGMGERRSVDSLGVFTGAVLRLDNGFCEQPESVVHGMDDKVIEMDMVSGRHLYSGGRVLIGMDRKCSTTVSRLPERSLMLGKSWMKCRPATWNVGTTFLW